MIMPTCANVEAGVLVLSDAQPELTARASGVNSLAGKVASHFVDL
jgi:hypothetical protein